MKTLGKLISLHRILFTGALAFTLLSAFWQLYWNSVLAELIDGMGSGAGALSVLFGKAAGVIGIHTVCEGLSLWLASCVCERFAHEMRLGYGRFYLRCGREALSRLKVGEEQSGMQNELGEISAWLNGNLFSFLKQFVSFLATVFFLLSLNVELTLLSTLPALGLLVYCFFSGRAMKNLTQECQMKKMQINGLAEMIPELFPVILIYDAYRLIGGAMEERLTEWQETEIRKERISAVMMSLSGALSFLPLLLLAGFGGSMVADGKISLGVFYIFINLSGNVSGFLQNMPGIYAGFRRFEASVERVGEKLVLPETE